MNNLNTLETKDLDELENELSGKPASDLLPGKDKDESSDSKVTPKEDKEKDEKEDLDGNGDDKGEKGGDPEKDDQDKKSGKDNIKKLLNQRNTARTERDEYKQELEEAKELLKKIKSGEMDDDFDSDEDRDLALIDARRDVKLAERDIKRIDRKSEMTKDEELSEFMSKNPDLEDLKDDIESFAKANPNLSMDHISKLVIAETDPTRLLDEQTKNKLKGGYGTSGKPNTTATKTPGSIDEMSDDELEKDLEGRWKKGEL